MILDELQALGDRLIAERAPSEIKLTAVVRTVPGWPDRLVFVARTEHPHRGGAATVTREAIEVNGDDDARVLLDDLCGRMEMGQGWPCDPEGRPPLLIAKVLNGWELPVSGIIHAN
ncbi:hypothetical protein [Deinococcus radiotolerans]|uniref:Uncharacterized protein n=1 Tax=Deinococcus radiotolerans TaxID=1309407 RepID=A0ABQ2FJY1_9DEIO|nr:hypothetical protein [Deinococcus radiotolerans]GGL05392.1 hypothetical protein GCM10010844_25200 [Deinococcus radiotolerans]